MPRLITRRAFLGGLLAVGAGGPAYAHWGEPRWLEVTRRPVTLGGGPALRIVQMSDLHASAVVSLDYIAEAVALAVAQNADVVVLTGDFITKRYEDYSRYAAILRPLAAAAPVFACAGNHDGGAWVHRFGGYPDVERVGRFLADAGIAFLKNEWRELSVRGRRWQLIATGDLWAGECRPARAFATLPPRGGAARILLSHNPDAKEMLAPFDWDLLVCGHTHGGQLRLPFLGAPFAPVRDKRFIEGLHRWDGRWLHITRGVGNLHGLRFNCRPEISVLDLA